MHAHAHARTRTHTHLMFLIIDILLSQKKLLDQLFENLQSLCNIFIIAPENIKQVCSEEPLVRPVVTLCI